MGENGKIATVYNVGKLKKDTLPTGKIISSVRGSKANSVSYSNIIPNNKESVKQKQFEIIQKTNPAPDSYHTWIRTVDDIKTLAEALGDEDWSEGGDFTPDLSSNDIQEAIERGNITVYSSYPIENGVFVSPSRMEAESYSGTGRVYEKTVDVRDVAWIDPTQGMYAEVTEKIKKNSYADEDHLASVQNNDMATAQKLVDEAAERNFKDSKARDSQGKLIKVYHGTESEDFYEFDKGRQGQTDSSLWGRGYYFTSEYDFAEMFGDNVRSFFLNITNPFTVSKVDAPASEIADKLMALGEEIDFVYSNLKAHEFAKAFGNQRLSDVLASHGYDGVIVGDVQSGYAEYVAFEQNQMKLSDPITYDDNGNIIPLSERFDDTKTDIRYHKKVDSNAKLNDNKSINNGGAVNGSQNTELLEQGTVSALGRGYDPIWKQSESARKILGYLGLVRERQTQNATDIGASDSRWLAPNAFKQQIDKGFKDGVLRALRGGSLSGKDVIGRELNNGTLDLLSNTILKVSIINNNLDYIKNEVRKRANEKDKTRLDRLLAAYRTKPRRNSKHSAGVTQNRNVAAIAGVDGKSGRRVDKASGDKAGGFNSSEIKNSSDPML